MPDRSRKSSYHGSGNRGNINSTAWDPYLVVLTVVGLFIGAFIFVVVKSAKNSDQCNKKSKKKRKDSGKEFDWENVGLNEEAQTKRQIFMQQLLSQRRWSNADVEKVASWSAINRDPDGWIDIDNPGLNLPGTNYISVDTLIVDLKFGTFELCMTESPENSCGFFNMDDVFENLKQGITECQFSLDQVDPNLRHHPFQLMNFGPAQLKGSNYCKTLLHADYLLKMMSQGSEVSAKYPFLIQDAYDRFLQLLDDDLQEEVKPLFLHGSLEESSVYRFWIESGELPYSVEIMEGGKIEFSFGYCPMEIKCHKMTYNSDGLLVDDNIDSGDIGTPAADFAAAFTENYDDIGQALPVFLRLRQLVIIGSVSKILQSIAVYGYESEFLKDCNVIRQFDIFNQYCRTLRARGIYYGIPLNLGYYSHNTECPWVPTAFSSVKMTTTKETIYAKHWTVENCTMIGGVRLSSKMARSSSKSQDKKSSNGNDKGGGGGGDGGDKKKKDKPKKHRNRRDCEDESVVYFLYPKHGLKTIGKPGISSLPPKKDGKYDRPEKQAKVLFKETGMEYKVEIYKKFPNRRGALECEEKLISLRRHNHNLERQSPGNQQGKEHSKLPVFLRKFLNYKEMYPLEAKKAKPVENFLKNKNAIDKLD